MFQQEKRDKFARNFVSIREKKQFSDLIQEIYTVNARKERK